jgi:hypothetical protein
MQFFSFLVHVKQQQNCPYMKYVCIFQYNGDNYYTIRARHFRLNTEVNHTYIFKNSVLKVDSEQATLCSSRATCPTLLKCSTDKTS